MDYNLLEYEIRSAGMTIGQFCKELGISRSAYYRKSRGVTEFTRSEIEKIMALLHIDNPTAIFFGKEVS